MNVPQDFKSCSPVTMSIDPMFVQVVDMDKSRWASSAVDVAIHQLR
jgi:hypothetical protein